MSHASESARRLVSHTTSIFQLRQLKAFRDHINQVYLLRFPADRTDKDAAHSKGAFQHISEFCSQLGEQATVCILTTPADAARLYPYLELSLRFQLWVAVKVTPNKDKLLTGHLP